MFHHALSSSRVNTYSFKPKMDSTLIFFVAAAIVVVVIVCRVRTKQAKHRPVPPGSLGFPFIGETVEFISRAYTDHPEDFMNKRCMKYGKIFKSHLFGSPTIISTDAEINKSILQSDARIFVPSYPKSLTELMGKSSILLINGNLQRRIHGLVGSFFKSAHLKAQVAKDMEMYIQESMKTWGGDCKQPILIQDEVKNISFQVLVKALVSLEPGEELEFLKKQFQEFILGLMSLPLNVPGSRLHKSLKAKKRMSELVKKIARERRGRGRLTRDRDPAIPRDVVDVLLGDTNEQMTDDLIADNVVDMMIPGEDSVPVLITLAVKYLSDCPAALHQLTEENIKMKRNKAQLGEPLHWSDYLFPPFTQQVISETLRIGNIIVGVMREATKDVRVKGYFIPRGWRVFAYFRSVHLDENNFDWPYQFYPWRWQDKDASSCNFTPFGGGQRLCPGLDLARLEAAVFLHHLVTQFTWVAEPDQVANFPTVRMKKRMPIWVQRRRDSC